MILHKAKDESVAENFFKYDYHDRGMKKWGGFYLSDHTAALKKAATDATPVERKSWQPQNYIREQLARAFAMKYPVAIQLATVDENGLLKADIVGQVKGYDGETVYIGETSVIIEEIRNIEVYK